MATQQPNKFIAERVESLAIMHLTRRSDLTVRREIRASDQVMDLLVEIKGSDTARAWKTFGIYLQGTKTAVTVSEANTKLTLSLRRFFSSYGEPSIPFCLFYFTMDDNKGYVTWLAEPVVDGKNFRLKYHKEKPECVELNDSFIEKIVNSVNLYYTKMYESAIRN